MAFSCVPYQHTRKACKSVENFTDLAIRALPQGTHYEKKTPGFGIRIGKQKKTWLVLQGPRDNRTQTIIGYYPSLTLQEARRRALVALGTRFSQKDYPTFPEALSEFLAQDRWKTRSKYVLIKSLDHFHWSKTLEKITHQDVLQQVDAVKGEGARSHAIKDIRTFFNWCVPRYLTVSPAVGLKMPTYVPRARVLSDDELRAVWIAAEQIGYPFGTITQLLILTGQRRSEIGSLQKSWISEDKITLPPEATKNGKEHSFPLSSLTVSSLAMVQNHKDTPLLFPARARSNTPFIGWGNSKTRLDKLAGIAPWTLHDLRRTFATGLASLGVPIHVTERLLNHRETTGGIIAVYQTHAYWPEQVQAIAAWESKLLSIVGNR